jgi:hypothetical protein
VPTSEITATGNWWLPDKEDKPARGTLRIGATGLGLELDGALDPIEPASTPQSYSPTWVQHETVCGDTDAGLFTLLKVQGMPFGLPPGSGTTEQYTVQAAIEAAVLEFPPSYAHLVFSTDYLDHWIRPEGPRAMAPVDDGPYGVTALRRQNFCSVDLGEGKVELYAFTRAKASQYSATIETQVVWGVTPNEPAPLYVMLQDWVGPLQNLVSFATLSPNRVADIRVSEATDTPLARVHLELRGDKLPASAPSYLWDHKLLLTPAVMRDHGAEIVAGWMRLSAEIPTVIARLLGRDYQTPTILEYYVSSVVQAAEGLHIALWNRRSRPADQHAARVRDCVQSIADPDLRTWAGQVLTNANGLSLRTRLAELVEHSREAGCPFLPENSNDFCRSLADYRNLVSHGTRASVEVSEIYWQASALTWVLRAIMLGRIGLEPDQVRRQFALNAEYQHAAHQLGWSTEE